MNKFIETADSRETSIEIMRAILVVAGGDEVLAERIWDDPSESETSAVAHEVGSLGVSLDEFYWGAEGNAWHPAA